ncbi:MAG: DUF6152 family protein [Steroidobacteraceae bacterium]
MAVAAAPVWAHHSSALFDFTTSRTFSGTVKEFQWTNPHVWVQVITTGADGSGEEWSLESGSVLIMKNMLGWNRTMINAGDKVTVRVNPSRDGSRSGMLAMIELPSGRRYELFTVPAPGKPAVPILP